jgi:hypothetical protein
MTQAMGKLILMPVVDGLAPLSPAAMYESVAAKYVKLAIHDFRRLVNEGIIPYRTHKGRCRRIYLKADLDGFLNTLPKGKIHPSEDSPSPTGKGT